MNRKILLGGVVAAVLVTGLWFMFLWRPIGAAVDEAEAREDAARAELQNLEFQRARLVELSARRPEFQSELESLRAAVPDRTDLAEVLLAVNTAAEGAGVELTDITAAEPVAADGFGLSPFDVQLSGSGGYFQLLDLLNRLADQHRIMVVNNISMNGTTAPDDLGPPVLNWTLSVQVFRTAAVTPDAGAAGGAPPDPNATPTATDPAADPAATDASGSQP